MDILQFIERYRELFISDIPKKEEAFARIVSSDTSSLDYDAFWGTRGDYDYVDNLSIIKHVLSEKDPSMPMRMINANILKSYNSLQQAIAKEKRAIKYNSIPALCL